MRRVLLTLLCLVSTALVLEMLGRTTPRHRHEGLDLAFEAFRQDKDRYDVLFFGSSRVHRGVRPRLIDEAFGRQGLKLTSFNLAMRGALAHETNELMRRVLALQPARLRYVVVELPNWADRRDLAFNSRTIAWQDLHETRSVLRTAWMHDAPRVERLDEIWFRLRVYGAHITNLGLGAQAARHVFDDLTTTALATRTEAVRRVVLDQGFGPFSPDEYRDGRTASHRKEFLRNRSSYKEQIGLLPELNAAPADLAHYNLAALRSQIELVRAAGAEIIYLIMPGHDAKPMLHRLADAGHLPSLIALDDPVAHPELFRVKNRFDYRHLNGEGSALLAPILAERLAAEMAPR